MNTFLPEHDIQAIHNVLMEQLSVAPSQLVPDADLQTDLMADSLDIIEITIQLEQHFNVTIPDERAEEVRTVGGIYEVIAELINNSGQPK